MRGGRIWLKSLDGHKICFLVVISAVICNWFHKNIPADSPVFYTTADFIESYGYATETHTVLTADGYLLDIYRITHKKSSNKTSGPPVLLQHGFLSSSSIWVFQGPDKDLSFMLSDQGYDVWLLNARGNSYTRLHPSSKVAYNDFSYHEMAMYDLPASIDHIIDRTGYSNVSYIGHSMGTTMIFAALSAKPEYNDKINQVFIIAPLVNVQPPLQFPGIKLLEGIYLLLNEVGNPLLEALSFNRKNIGRSIFYRFTSSIIPNEVNEIVLNATLKFLAGANSTCHITIPGDVFLAHNPDGLWHRILDHYHLNMMQGHFRMRDFGLEGNILAYNETTPPLYNLNNINVPITALLGMADEVSPPEEFIKAISEVRKKVKIRKYENFNHFDVIWSLEATHTLFQDILNTLRVISPT